MTYPGGAGYPITEWLIDGVWTDLTDRVRGDITITRGRQNEQGTVSPTTAEYLADNADRELSNRNPNSDWYRLIPQGTQTRTRAGDGDNHMFMRYNTFADDDGTSVRTTDKAALDITGDLEVRVDVRPHTWRPANRFMMFAAKYLQTGNQRSWVLYVSYTGRVFLAWSPDGTSASRISAGSTVDIPATTGRLAIKATLDVNNGAAGHTVRFYTAPTIDGTYTQLGADVVTAGTTSVFASTAALVVGGGDDIVAVFSNGAGFGGRFYGFHLYSGIGGSRVANPDFTAWGLDDTSVADSHSNTWEVSGQARVSSPRIRFWGELASSAQETDKTGTDITVPVRCADPTEALGDGQQPVESPLALNIGARSGLLGWWKHEDGAASTQAASGLPAGVPGAASLVTFGVTSDLPGAVRVAELTQQPSKITYRVAKGSNTGVWQTVFLFKVGSLPASETVFATFLTTGLARTIEIEMGGTTFGINFYAADNSLLDSAGVTFGAGVAVQDEWMAMRLQLDTSGGNINWALAWYQQGSADFWGTSDSFAGTSIGQPHTVFLSANRASEFAGMQLSHLVVSEIDLGFSTDDLTWSSAINAYAGESAAARVQRITTTAGIYCEVTGEVDSSIRMGPQAIDTPLNVLLDAAKVDGGFLAGLRDFYGLGYRTRQDLERHQDAALTYGTHLFDVPQNIDDIQGLTNDVELSRSGGSSARAQILTGYTSILPPPAGVGQRKTGGEVNVFTDSQLLDAANLRARYSSFDQARIPNLSVILHGTTTLPSTTAGLEVAHLDLGATIAVSGWPAHLPPDTIRFLLQGYTETLGRFLWSWKANVSPAGPYQTGVWDSPDEVAGLTRYGSGSSTLNAGITTTATTIVVAGAAVVTTVEVWTTDAGMYPLDVMIGGERITLGTPPSGSTSPQTFTNVTRSVNGIVRAHDAGTRVTRFSPTFYGMSGD
jgi:hypothetical protein